MSITDSDPDLPLAVLLAENSWETFEAEFSPVMHRIARSGVDMNWIRNIYMAGFSDGMKLNDRMVKMKSLQIKFSRGRFKS